MGYGIPYIPDTYIFPYMGIIMNWEPNKSVNSTIL